MKTFADNAGRTWTLSITVDAIKRVQALCKINLVNLTDTQRDAEVPLITELEIDLMLLVDTIYAIVKPQADKGGITDEQFGQALGGEAIARAHAAFWEELRDFFQSLPSGKAVARAIDKQMEMVRAAVKAGEQYVEQLNVDQRIAEAFGASSSS